MATTVINSHKVEDFARWRAAFDLGAGMREQAGVVIKGIYQSVEDANTVILVSEVPSVEMAKAMYADEKLQTIMREAGVISTPEISYLNEVI